MVRQVLRYKCDICGSLSMIESLAEFCELECSEIELAKAIEAQRAETVKHGSVADESAVANGDLPKGG